MSEPLNLALIEARFAVRYRSAWALSRAVADIPDLITEVKRLRFERDKLREFVELCGPPPVEQGGGLLSTSKGDSC